MSQILLQLAVPQNAVKFSGIEIVSLRLGFLAPNYALATSVVTCIGPTLLILMILWFYCFYE